MSKIKPKLVFVKYLAAFLKIKTIGIHLKFINLGMPDPRAALVFSFPEEVVKKQQLHKLILKNGHE